MGDLQNLTKELLKDQEFKKEFEKLQSDYVFSKSKKRGRSYARRIVKEDRYQSSGY